MPRSRTPSGRSLQGHRKEKNRRGVERSSLHGGFSALRWSWWDLNPRPDKALASFLHA